MNIEQKGFSLRCTRLICTTDNTALNGPDEIFILQIVTIKKNSVLGTNIRKKNSYSPIPTLEHSTHFLWYDSAARLNPVLH